MRGPYPFKKTLQRMLTTLLWFPILLLLAAACNVAAVRSDPTPEPPRSITVTATPSTPTGYGPTAQPARTVKFTTTRPVQPGTPPNITATTPQANAEVSSPVRVEGTASVFEATVSFAVRDAQGKEIGKGFTTASEGAPGTGKYTMSLAYTLTGQKQDGWVQVLSHSARDGSVQDLLEIPVVLLPNR